MQEVWKPVEGFEGYYEVSNLGRIKSLSRAVKHSSGSIMWTKEKLLSAMPSATLGYVLVSLRKDGKSHKLYAHRIVAEAFIPNPQNLPIINHIDGNKANNSADNLEWCTRAHNVSHAYSTGLMDNSGRKHYKARAVVNCRGEEFPTCVAAAEAYKIKAYTNVWYVCQGTRKTAGTYPDGSAIVWKYKDSDKKQGEPLTDLN